MIKGFIIFLSLLLIAVVGFSNGKLEVFDVLRIGMAIHVVIIYLSY